MTRPVINESQLRQVRRAIREAELPPAKARKLLVRIAKYGLIPAARRNVKAQRTPEGAAWHHEKDRIKPAAGIKTKCCWDCRNCWPSGLTAAGKVSAFSSKRGLQHRLSWWGGRVGATARRNHQRPRHKAPGQRSHAHPSRHTTAGRTPSFSGLSRPRRRSQQKTGRRGAENLP